MKNKAQAISTYAYSDADVFLFDANIWLYLFPAPSGAVNYNTKVYSAAFKDILAAGSKLVIGATILSEYLNRYCRIEYDARFSATYTSFKKFRLSTDFRNIGSDAEAYALQILRHCTQYDDKFSEISLVSVLKSFGLGETDFNDELIVDSCRRNGWKLVTNDGDFSLGGIDLLTANARLLTSCK